MDIGPIIVMNTKLLLGVIITPSNNFVFIKSVLSRTCMPSLCNYQSCMVMISIVSWGIVALGSWCQPHSQGPPTPPSGARETGKRGPWELGSSRSLHNPLGGQQHKGTLSPGVSFAAVFRVVTQHSSPSIV